MKDFQELIKHKIIYAKDFKCCVTECDCIAEGFFPIIDSNIPFWPYCEEHITKEMDNQTAPSFIKNLYYT